MELRLPLEVFPGRQATCRAGFGTWGQKHAVIPHLGAEASPFPGGWHNHLATLSLWHLLCLLTVSLEFPLGPDQPGETRPADQLWSLGSSRGSEKFPFY